jgi:membrane associated rhomboid family serine protease
MTQTIPALRIGPEFTPPSIRKLIALTLFMSLGSALSNAFFTELLGMSGPQRWLSLSWWGIERYMVWQPLSFLFVHPLGYTGVGFYYFISLLFNTYLLWVMGSDICMRVSEKSFVRLYLASGVAAGLITLLAASLIGQPPLISGATPAVLGILTVWSFLHPEQELLLFFLLPVKAKWLALGIVGFMLLSAFSSLQFLSFTLNFSGVAIAYLYALIAWGIHSPFTPFYRIELALIRFSQKIRRAFSFLIPDKKSTQKTSKVVNIRTGEPTDDDAFIDKMLEKISKYGENSLSWSEKKRMDKISENKSKKFRN